MIVYNGSHTHISHAIFLIIDEIDKIYLSDVGNEIINHHINDVLVIILSQYRV